MAAGGLARGCRAHGASRRQPRDRRCVQLGPHRADAGRARFRLARRRARPAARARDRRRPGDAHRIAAAVARDRPPRDAPGRPRRRAAHRRVAQSVHPRVAGVPRARARDHDRPGPPIRRPPRGADVACRQRVRPDRLRRGGGARVPRVAARAVRHDRGAQRGVEHARVVAALPRLRRRAAASAHAVPGQPGAVARLPPVHLRPAGALLRRAARRDPRRRRDAADHDELHGVPAAHRPVVVGRRGRRHRRRSVPRPRLRHGLVRHRADPGPDAVPRRRTAVGAHGAGDQRHELAPAQPAEVAAACAARFAPGGCARRRCGVLLPVAAGSHRRGALPLRDAPARGRRHRGVRRCLRPRRRSAAPAADHGRPGRGIRRPALRLAVVVGGNGAGDADGPPRSPRAGAAVASRAVAAGRRRRPRAPRRRPVPVPRRAHAAVVHRRDGCRGRAPRRARGWREPGGRRRSRASPTRMRGSCRDDRRCCCASWSG